jgi:hypothetical protein
MTNNEILNSANADGYLGSVSASERKTWEGDSFSYIAKAILAENTAAYRGLVTGDAIVHLKSLDVVTEDADVTVEISEDAVYTGGTEVNPVARNRRTELVDYHDSLTMNFNVATALTHQPIHGTPVLSYVFNNGNRLYPDVAVEITADPIGSTGYGIEVKDVAQVDISQGLALSYKSKQVRKVIKREDYAAADWTPDTLKVFTGQDYAGAKPIIKAVYNNDNVPLVLASDYTIDKDLSDDWGITVLSTSETVDDTKNIIVVFEIEEEYNADYVDEITSFSLDKQKLAVDTITGTFEVGEIIEGGTSHATGKIIKLDTGFIYVDTVVGTFVDEETVTGKTSEASTALTADTVKFYWVAFENQSHDDSAITVATVANGLRGTLVEYLSFTQDYTFAYASGWKITLKDTAKTDQSKPVAILYQAYSLIGQADGLKIYTGPTVTAQGNVLDTYWLPGATGVGTSRIASGASDQWELVLRPNTKYLIKAVSSVAQDIVIKYKWYLED